VLTAEQAARSRRVSRVKPVRPQGLGLCQSLTWSCRVGGDFDLARKSLGWKVFLHPGDW
jgi:hypothetical protein